MSPHPRRSELVALLDGEVDPARRLRLQLHLLTCADCRLVRGDIRADQATVRAYLGELDVELDLGQAWARLQTQQVDLARQGPRARGGLTLAAGAVLLLVGAIALWRTHRPFVATLEALPTRSDLVELRQARSDVGDAQFIDGLLGLVRNGTGQVLRDTCCADHDGEGPDDDGIFALAVPSRHLTVLVTYDDADGSRTLTAGDLVRSATRAQESQVAALAGNTTTLAAR